jgi:tRNA dimethylallyltransferase
VLLSHSVTSPAKPVSVDAATYNAHMPIDHRPLAIFLMGPTASGKTALACELSERFPLELVSVDSALVYRGMDIGTAKPDPATLARYPHALVDIRDPSQPYSAADFCADAELVMERISAQGRVPLLVGGTGLYFRALQRGLSNLPEADPTTRERLGAEARQSGWPAMHARLAEIDPVAAQRIDSHDTQRLQRALEVFELTGRPLSELQRADAATSFPWRVLKLALLPVSRQLLHERIARRFDTMLEEGFLDEVRTLRARGDLDADLPAIQILPRLPIAYSPDGQTSAADFRDRAIFATRQLAKRQITWLRSDPAIRQFEPDHAGLLVDACNAVELFVHESGGASSPV